MEEKWLDVEGYEGLYQVSNLGNVKSFAWGKDKPIKSHPDSRGYHQVTLRKDNKRKHHMVHRLVANAFIPNPEGKAEVNHDDFDKNNNAESNLQWMTRRENIMYSIQHGRHSLENLKPRRKAAWS